MTPRLPPTILRVILTMALVLTPARTFAHPHMFFDNEATFVFEEGVLSRIELSWTFDAFFTESILLDYDADRNRSISDQESHVIHDNAFQNLQYYGFFTYIDTGSGRWQPEEIADFRADLIDQRLRYRFSIPLTSDQIANRDMVRLTVYDESFFCDCRTNPNTPPRVEGDIQGKARVVVERDASTELVYDPTAGLTSRGVGDQNGGTYSGTAFPHQITVRITR